MLAVAEYRPLPKEIWITGMGAISPGGKSPAEMWANAMAGKSGIVSVEQPYTNIKVAGRVTETDPHVILGDYIPNRRERTRFVNFSSRPTVIAEYAISQALEDAKVLDQDGQLDENQVDRERGACIIGTGIGGALHIARSWDILRARGEESLGAAPIIQVLPDSSATGPGVRHKFQGPTFTIVAACATGGMVGSAAIEKILLGRADYAVFGATEACLGDMEEVVVEVDGKKEKRLTFVNSPIAYELFNFGAVTKNLDPRTASRPQDENRDGFVPSEGAGAFFIETADHARARGINAPYAKIVGYGETADAYHRTMLNGEGARRALELAASTVKWNLGDGILVAKLHSTGTAGEADGLEDQAVKSTFQDRVSEILAFAPKSRYGHALGAAGAIELAEGVMVLVHQEVPPTLNCDNPIPAARELHVSKLSQKPHGVIGHLASDSFGFGGMNSGLILEYVREGKRYF